MASAAAAGGGGGGSAMALEDPLSLLADTVIADSLLDCSKSVINFAHMLNIKFQSTRNPNHIMTGIIDSLMTGVDSRVPVGIAYGLRVIENPRLEDGHGDLQYLTRPDGKGGQQKVKGAYGNILISRSNPNIIWKEINYLRSDRYGNIVNILPNVFIEAFIQFILADAYDGSNFVIPVLDIRKAPGEDKKIFICMERAKDDVFGFLRHNLTHQNSSWRLPDKIFYNVLNTILINLIDYHNKFNLVHRDAKSDNFVYIVSGGRAHIKMIDFGFTCIDIKIGDKIYNVKTSNNNYNEDVPCMPQQDALVLLLELEIVFGKFFSPKTKVFYDTVLTPPLREEMTRRQAPFVEKQQEHLASYNKNGTLTVHEPKLANYLTPSFVLETLAAVFAQSGGRRKKTRRIVDGGSSRRRRRRRSSSGGN